MSATSPIEQDSALPPLAQYFSQLGYVVSDIEATVAVMEKSLGTKFTRSEGTGLPSELRYRGKPHGASVLLAFGQLHGIELEIIQPVSDENLYTEFLKSRGSGLHHAGFKVPDHDKYTRYYDLMIAARGIPVLEGRIEREIRVEFCYFDCSVFGASFVEITHFF